MNTILVCIFLGVLAVGAVTLYNVVQGRSDAPADTGGPGGGAPDTQVH